MKKIFSVFLALILCFMTTSSAFAISRPDSERAIDWKRYAEEAAASLSLREAAFAYEKAAELFGEDLDENPDLMLEITDCYKKAGILYFEAHMLDEAIARYETAGDIYLKYEEYERAKEIYSTALRIAADNDKHDYEQGLEEKLGDVYAALGKFQDAASYYGHNLDYLEGADYARVSLKYANSLEHFGEKEEIAMAFVSASDGACQQGDAAQAIELAKKAADYFKQNDQEILAQQAIAHLIVVLMQSGNSEYAARLVLDFYEMFGPVEIAAAMILGIAVPYYNSIGDNENLSLSYTKAGDIYNAIGNDDLAKECFKKASEYKSAASIITNGNLAIITGIAGLLIGFIIAILFLKKKALK